MPKSSSQHISSRGRIMITNQDRDMLQVAKSLFEREGFDVQVLDSVFDINDVDTSCVDMLLLDVTNLDDEHLSEITHFVQLNSDCPVLVTSDYFDSANILAVLNAGVRDYIIKPFSSRELVDRVNKILEK